MVCGIVNITSDSFSDGGQHLKPDHAMSHALKLIEDGAGMVDIGGESTRPGATPVSVDEEIDRVLPVLEGLRSQTDVLISVDTTKSKVALEALAHGADIINDVSGGLFDEEMIEVVKKSGAGFICGHVEGANLDQVHKNQDACKGYSAVLKTLCSRIAFLKKTLGGKIIADPCVGFGKSSETNRQLIRSGEDITQQTGAPVMIGVSRKRVLGDLTGLSVEERDHATVGASLAAVCFGAKVLRVHNVKFLTEALMAFWPLHSKGSRLL